MDAAGRFLVPLLLINMGVGIALAVDPPWPLWGKFAAGVLLGLVLIWLADCLRRAWR